MRPDLPAAILDAIEAYRDVRDAWGIDHDDQLEECKAAADELVDLLDDYLGHDEED